MKTNSEKTFFEKFLAGIRWTPALFTLYLPLGLILNGLYPRILEYLLVHEYIKAPPAGREYLTGLVLLHLAINILLILLILCATMIYKRYKHHNG